MTNLCSYQYCCGVHRFSQGYGVRVEVPWSPGFRLESESFIWRRLRLWALSVPSGILCNFVAVYLTFVQFILQLKLCWYTVVHLLLQEFKISLKSSLSTQSCHTISPRVGVPQKKKQGFRIPGCSSSYLEKLGIWWGAGLGEATLWLCDV